MLGNLAFALMWDVWRLVVPVEVVLFDADDDNYR